MLDGEILETHELLHVHQRHLPGRAIALFGDDDLDQSLVLARFIVGAMQHHYRVGILFDGAAFAQIAQTRAMVLAVLGAAVDLGAQAPPPR